MTDRGPFPTLDFVKRGGTWSAIEMVAAAERYPDDYQRVTGHDPRWVKVYAQIGPPLEAPEAAVRRLVIEVHWRGHTHGEVFFYDDTQEPQMLPATLNTMVARLDQALGPVPS